MKEKQETKTKLEMKPLSVACQEDSKQEGQATDSNPSPSLTGGLPDHEVSEKHHYCLTVLRDGEYQPLTPEELEQFEEQYPEIAQYWLFPEELETVSEPKCDLAFESWNEVAKELMN